MLVYFMLYPKIIDVYEDYMVSFSINRTKTSREKGRDLRVTLRDPSLSLLSFLTNNYYY